MKDREPTVRARELGLALNRAIDVAGKNQRDLALKLGWSQAKVSRLFSGKRTSNPEDISAVLALCGIIGPKRDQLMDLARHVNEPSWWQEYGDRLPPELCTLSDHEDAAIAITSFQTMIVPGLLQTDSYMRGLMTSNLAIPDDEVDERVKARKRRRRIFERRDQVRFRFFIDEYAVRRTGPGPVAMSDQLHQLLRMAVRPSVDIRIVPDAVGFHAGQQPFHLMEFIELNPVVHIEDMTSVFFLERKDTIAGYRRIAAELDRIALDEGQSRAWLAQVASELASPREEHDEHARPGHADLAEEFFYKSE